MGRQAPLVEKLRLQYSQSGQDQKSQQRKEGEVVDCNDKIKGAKQ